MHTICDDYNCLNAVQKQLSKNIFQNFYLFVKLLTSLINFFTLNLVLHKTNIRLFHFDLYLLFKSFDHLLVEILLIIIIITFFILRDTLRI